MQAAALWSVIALLVAASATALLRQAQLLRAAREHEALLERQLAHACGFALAGQLGAAGLHDTYEALDTLLTHACRSRTLAQQGEAGGHALQAELLQISAHALHARDNIQRLGALLAPARDDSGLLDANEVVAQALKVLRPQARQHGIELVLQATPVAAFVRGERRPLELVVLQLVANALDAMQDTPSAHRRVLVSTHHAAGRIEVQVSDRGHGFGARQPDALFAPYYTTKQGHMGLGLCVARRIVEAHEGRIEGRRRAGGGAVFTVSLPQRAAEAVAAAVPATSSSPFTAACVVQP